MIKRKVFILTIELIHRASRRRKCHWKHLRCLQQEYEELRPQVQRTISSRIFGSPDLENTTVISFLQQRVRKIEEETADLSESTPAERQN